MCKGCGECCSNLLPISVREYATIKAYIEKHDIKEQKNVVAVEDINCPFMDLSKKKDRCLIYEVRPLICKDYTCEAYYNHEPPKADFSQEARYPVNMRGLFYGG